MTATDESELSDFDAGVVVGILIGEGSFGGDGKQPQITLRMHTRHEALFRWLVARFPRTKLYGPYGHGGRSYFQWMARGPALVEDVLPVIERHLTPSLDEYAFQRFRDMCAAYQRVLGPIAPAGSGAAESSTPTRAHPDSE